MGQLTTKQAYYLILKCKHDCYMKIKYRICALFATFMNQSLVTKCRFLYDFE